MVGYQGRFIEPSWLFGWPTCRHARSESTLLPRYEEWKMWTITFSLKLIIVLFVSKNANSFINTLPVSRVCFVEFFPKPLLSDLLVNSNQSVPSHQLWCSQRWFVLCGGDAGGLCMAVWPMACFPKQNLHFHLFLPRLRTRFLSLYSSLFNSSSSSLLNIFPAHPTPAQHMHISWTQYIYMQYATRIISMLHIIFLNQQSLKIFQSDDPPIPILLVAIRYWSLFERVHRRI